MPMPDLKDEQDKWQVEEVHDKQLIKGTIYYLIKWAGWPFKYNSYESVFHLAKTSKAVAVYKQTLKHKKVSNKSHNDNNDNESIVDKISHKHA